MKAGAGRSDALPDYLVARMQRAVARLMQQGRRIDLSGVHGMTKVSWDKHTHSCLSVCRILYRKVNRVRRLLLSIILREDGGRRRETDGVKIFQSVHNQATHTHTLLYIQTHAHTHMHYCIYKHMHTRRHTCKQLYFQTQVPKMILYFLHRLRLPPLPSLSLSLVLPTGEVSWATVNKLHVEGWRTSSPKHWEENKADKKYLCSTRRCHTMVSHGDIFCKGNFWVSLVNTNIFVFFSFSVQKSLSF